MEVSIPSTEKQPRMAKEFRSSFSLEEGDISEPFKTDFGYHILYLEKIRGQEYDVRHILLRPRMTDDAITAAKEKLEKVRQSIDGDISFAEAAKEASDEKKQSMTEVSYVIQKHKIIILNLLKWIQNCMLKFKI